MAISEFSYNIDRNYSSEESIILRYRNYLCSTLLTSEEILLDNHLLERVSILEGTRLYPFLSYKNVDIFILDETSFMASGTFKSLDACISIANTKIQGAKKLVFESGGNTGTAFSIYAAKMNMQSFFIVPTDNLPILSAKAFIKPYNYVIGVRDPQKLKMVSEKIEELTDAFRIPNLEWRYISSMFRGCRILEYLLNGGKVDWFSQTISAGFGPIGISKIFNIYKEDLPSIPKFLGIQQAENCPYYNKIKGVNTEVSAFSTKDFLIPIMYDVNPFSYKAFADFKRIIDDQGGMLTINKEEFNRFIQKEFNGGKICQLLEKKGTSIYQEQGNILDKAGLVGLAGVFKAIDLNFIKKGETVLHCLSSGTFQKRGTLQPDCVIDETKPIAVQVESFLESIGSLKNYAKT